MPANHGVRLHDDEGIRPAARPPTHRNPEGPIDRFQARPEPRPSRSTSCSITEGAASPSPVAITESEVIETRTGSENRQRWECRTAKAVALSRVVSSPVIDARSTDPDGPRSERNLPELSLSVSDDSCPTALVAHLVALDVVGDLGF